MEPPGILVACVTMPGLVLGERLYTPFYKLELSLYHFLVVVV